MWSDKQGSWEQPLASCGYSCQTLGSQTQFATLYLCLIQSYSAK